MRRALSILGIAVMTLSMAACGKPSVTIKINFLGIQATGVATGDQAAIDHLKGKLQQSAAALPGAVTISDGDHPEGNKVCEKDETSDGFTYHVTVYSNSPEIKPNSCDNFTDVGGGGGGTNSPSPTFTVPSFSLPTDTPDATPTETAPAESATP